MRTNLYWVDTGVPGRLATMSRPRAGDWLEDEMKFLKNSGIDVVVSLLTDDEVSELQLEGEHDACVGAGLRFVSFPIEDRHIPGGGFEVFRALSEHLVAGRSLAIHCRMGIGRASLVAAAVLRLLGVSGEDTLTRIQNARGLAIPDTEEQRRWVLNFSGEGER